jgi:polysaccharide export outer membrane protein
MKSARLLASATLTLLCATGAIAYSRPAQAQFSPTAATATTTQTAEPLKPGDQIRLTVVGFDELSGEQAIAADGTIQLPMAGAIDIGRLTPTQAVSRITQSLLPYVRRPQVSLAVVSLSPIHISITGEVIQPGPRLITPTETRNNTTVNNNAPVTLSRALLLAGGITPNADLRNIVVRRHTAEPTLLARQTEPGRTDINVDLWQVIQSGDLDSDLRIYDGDEIIVPVAQAGSMNQQTLLASTVAPDTITIQVAGEVQKPGQIEISPRSGVSEAVAAAGGLTKDGSREDIALFRMAADGRLTSRNYTFGEASEPLMNGDLIYVGKSNRGSVGNIFDFLGRLLNPLAPILRLF